MKNSIFLQEVAAITLSLILILSPATVGFDGFADFMSLFAVKANAEGEFEDTNGYLSYKIENNKVTITECNQEATGEMVVPNSVDGYPVTKIFRNAFEMCNLEKIVLPDTVEEIDQYSFYSSLQLREVILPESLLSIGSEAFSDCINLKHVVIPKSVTSLGSLVFVGCDNLESLSVEEGNIKYYSLDNCIIDYDSKAIIEGCKGSSIPNSIDVTTIGENAFSFCTELKSITIPSNIIHIENGAFAGCNGLESITVSADNPVYHSLDNCLIETSAKRLVLGCKNSIIPDDGSVAIIGFAAFFGCINLNSITIPDKINMIEGWAFAQCIGLKAIKIPGSVTEIDDIAFKCCVSLETVILGEGVQIIGDQCFEWCTGIETITIPKTIEHIGKRAFELNYLDDSGELEDLISFNELGIKGTHFIVMITLGTAKALHSKPVSCLNSVYFYGNQSEWNSKEISEGNDDLLSTSISYLGEYEQHKHIDIDSDCECDICNTIYRYSISEDESISFEIPEDDMREAVFECHRTGKYTFSGRRESGSWWSSKSIDLILDSDHNVIDGESSGNKTCYSFNQGETYIIVFNNDYSDLCTQTVILKCSHIDENNDFNCDFCDFNYRFAISLDENVTTHIPPGETFEYVFTPEESAKYEINNSEIWINGNKIYGQLNEYTNSYVYELGQDNDYIIRISSRFDDDEIFTKDVVVSHHHYGDEEYIVEPSAASFGVMSLTCQECGKKFYKTVRMTGEFEEDENGKEFRIKDGIIYYVLKNGNTREIVVVGCTREAGIDVIVPESIDGIPVTAVGGGESNAWQFNDKMEKLTIPNGVRSLIYPLLYCNGSLKEIILPDSLEMMLGGVGSLSLKKATLGKGLKYIGEYSLVNQEFILNELYGADVSDYDNLTEEQKRERISRLKSDLLDDIQNDKDFLKAIDETGLEFNTVEDALDYFVDKNIESEEEIFCYSDWYLLKGMLLALDNMNYDPIVLNYNGTQEEWNNIIIAKDNYFSGMRFLGDETVHTHTPGEWKTVREPTETEVGKAIKECMVCGEIIEEKELPRLDVIKDEATGLELVLNSENYDGEVTISVIESFEGKAFNIVNTQTGAVQQSVYDVMMIVNGKETQPVGRIKVKIPLPEGFNPDQTFVYHINTEIGKAEKMNAVYENGFMVFETDHFSYYAIVDETPVEQPNPTAPATLNIKSSVTVDYRSNVTVTATADNVPDGYVLAIYDGNNQLTKGDNKSVSLSVGEMKESKTFTVKIIDENGSVQKDGSGSELSKNCEINVKSGLLSKIIAFFKALFRRLPTVEVKP